MVEEPQKIEQEIKTEQELKDIICLLWTEIKKDWLFFGLFGFVVMCFFLIENFFSGWLPAFGPRISGSLADESSGIISFSVYGLLMLGLIGSITNILSCFKQQYAWLNNMYVCSNNMVKHVEHRLRQLASVTISFAAGVISFALLHAIVTVTSTGIILAALTFFFMVFIYIFFVPVHIIIWRIEPFKDRQLWDKWWKSALVLLLILAVILLILAGYLLHIFIFAFAFLLLAWAYKKYCSWREKKQQQV